MAAAIGKFAPSPLQRCTGSLYWDMKTVRQPDVGYISLKYMNLTYGQRDFVGASFLCYFMFESFEGMYKVIQIHVRCSCALSWPFKCDAPCCAERFLSLPLSLSLRCISLACNCFLSDCLGPSVRLIWFRLMHNSSIERVSYLGKSVQNEMYAREVALQ